MPFRSPARTKNGAAVASYISRSAGARRSVTARRRREPRCSVATAWSRLRTASKSASSASGRSWTPAVQAVPARSSQARSTWARSASAASSSRPNGSGTCSGTSSAGRSPSGRRARSASGRLGSMPAARNGSTPTAISICVGAPGSTTTRSWTASARSNRARAGIRMLSLPGGPNSLSAAGELKAAMKRSPASSVPCRKASAPTSSGSGVAPDEERTGTTSSASMRASSRGAIDPG